MIYPPLVEVADFPSEMSLNIESISITPFLNYMADLQILCANCPSILASKLFAFFILQ